MRKHSYNFVKNYLAERGILLKSKKYRGSKAKLRIQFPCGCEGRSNFNSLQSGRLCKNCAPNARVTAERYRELARQNHGKILAIARTATDLSQWSCRKGHTFLRPFSTIFHQRIFCPICSQGLSERICRAAAEQLFGMPFKKVKLRGVRGVGGGYLELDAYSELLHLAIEHNGQQHYQPSRFGNQTEEGATYCFRKQQEHDRRRREFCAANGITLIEVPELGRRTMTEDLKEFIRVECQKASFKLPESFDGVQLKLEAHNLTTTAEEIWARILTRVRELDYVLKTTSYPGANGRLSLVCRNGHDYKPRVANLLNGYTCRRCLIQQRTVPVVILPLGTKARSGSYASARICDSIENCAKALKANPNNVRTVAKGRGNSCNGFGVAQITPEQAKGFRENKEELKSFCRAKWPSPKTYDRQDGSRKHLSKPVRFSDGREFPSKSAAAKALAVSKSAIYYAVLTGNPCKGHEIQERKSK